MILLPTIISEIDFIYSTKESKNKDAVYIFCNGKFSEDEQGEIGPEQRTQNIFVTFINRFEAEMIFQ